MIRNNGIWMMGLAGLLLSNQAHAIVIAEYKFDLSEPSQTAAATSSGPGITAGQAIVGDFLDDDLGTTGPRFSSGFFVRASDTRNPAQPGDNLLSNALAAGDFISFTITGTNYDITKISFNYVTSGDGFAFSSYVFTDALVPSAFVDPTALEVGDSLLTTNRSGNTNLSTSQEVLPGLTGLTGTTEFRIYFSDGSFNSGHSHTIDDIVIQGTPEPGSLALLGLGGLCLTWRRRRD